MTYQRQSLWAGVRGISSYIEFPCMIEIQEYQDELIDIEIELPSHYDFLDIEDADDAQLEISPTSELMNRFANLKSLDLDSRKTNEFQYMFNYLSYSPNLERLSITLLTPIQYSMLYGLKRLDKLNYLKVNFNTKSSAERMDHLWPSISRITKLKVLEVTSDYGCNVSRLCASLPDIEQIKLKIGGQCIGLESIASLRTLNKFDVKICEKSSIDIIIRLLDELFKVRPIRNNLLTLSLLSSKMIKPQFAAKTDDLNDERRTHFETTNALRLCCIADGRTFKVTPVEARNLFQLLIGQFRDQKYCQMEEIMLVGEVDTMYEDDI